MEKGFPESEVNCLICREAELIDGRTSVTFGRDELRLVINNVPARVCPHCGEAYVEEDVALQLLLEAGKMSGTGMMDDVIGYAGSGVE